MKRITLGMILAGFGLVAETVGLIGSAVFLAATGGSLKPILVVLSVLSIALALGMLLLLLWQKLPRIAPLCTIPCAALGMAAFLTVLSGQLNYIGMAAVGMNPWLPSLFVMLGGYLLSTVLFTVAGFLPLQGEA